MVDPICRALTPTAAKSILTVRADDETQQRIDELANKCSEGTLSSEESLEYREFVSIFAILTILQARARTISEVEERH